MHDWPHRYAIVTVGVTTILRMFRGAAEWIVVDLRFDVVGWIRSERTRLVYCEPGRLHYACTDDYCLGSGTRSGA